MNLRLLRILSITKTLITNERIPNIKVIAIFWSTGPVCYWPQDVSVTTCKHSSPISIVQFVPSAPL